MPLIYSESVYGHLVFSEVYLAETPEETDLPRKLCIKIATSQSLGHHSHESVLNDFWYQKKILKDIQHPFIVKGFSTILAEIPDCLATELGVCTLQELQAVSPAPSNLFHKKLYQPGLISLTRFPIVQESRQSQA